MRQIRASSNNVVGDVSFTIDQSVIHFIRIHFNRIEKWNVLVNIETRPSEVYQNFIKKKY